MRYVFVIAIVFGAFLAACSGSGSSIPSAGTSAAAPGQSSPSNATGTATFAIFIPAAGAMKRVRPNYVSPNTQYAGITLTEVSGSPVPSPTPLVVSLTPGSPNCSTSANGTTCTLTATYRVGSDAWTIALYGQGGVTSTPLSINSVGQNLVAGQNTVDLTMNPVIASLAFSPSSGTCASNDATCTQSAVLEALDATNAVIVGPGNYVNASQVPVTINVSPAPSGVTLETSSGSAAATTASGPAQMNLAQIAYNGSDSAGQLSINASDTNGDRASYTLNVTASAAPTPTGYPSDPPAKIRSTYGRIGLAQIFDYFPSTNTSMSASQIAADASRYDLVWGSFDPQPWRSSNPQALVSRYYIIEEDNTATSGYNLQWWQQNHPDWILYACTSSGTPTHDIAYSPGDGFADVPLNFHNPAVVQYQVASLINYMQANGYNAMALDQVIFNDFMVGGNPELGQTENTSEYACGTWNDDGTFNTVYSSPSDPTWTQDVLNWVSAAKAAASAASPAYAVIVNHPAISTVNANEQALMKMVDGEVEEPGFSDYGDYQTQPAYFLEMYKYMEWVEQQGIAFVDIDRYTLGGETSPTSDQVEYSIGTYMMGNEGNADLYVDANNGSGYGYGSEQYHPEYATQLGSPCSAMTQDPANAQIYYRRFQNGMVVVNSGGDGTENATLPTDHVYTDIEGRTVTNPLPVSAYDAWVLTTGGGNGCS
ncbi:MAG TPA: hypothetical protein VMG98_13145 [Verrucomicrobiae bacterium]|nr:hypothetical protein [Verrucomicrobiae bacterium]